MAMKTYLTWQLLLNDKIWKLHVGILTAYIIIQLFLHFLFSYIINDSTGRLDWLENQPVFLLWVTVSSCLVSVIISVSSFSSFINVTVKYIHKSKCLSVLYRLLIIDTPKSVRSLIKTRTCLIKNILREKELKKPWEGQFNRGVPLQPWTRARYLCLGYWRINSGQD